MRMLKAEKALACLTVALLAIASGCSRHPNQAKVVGTLIYKGKPVNNAHLMFTSGMGRPGFADADEQGHFEAFTFTPGDGLLVGEHVVTVTPHFYTPQAGVRPGRDNIPEDATPDQFQRWPDRYLTASQSPLRITVESGKVNDVELVLED